MPSTRGTRWARAALLDVIEGRHRVGVKNPLGVRLLHENGKRLASEEVAGLMGFNPGRIHRRREPVRGDGGTGPVGRAAAQTGAQSSSTSWRSARR